MNRINVIFPPSRIRPAPTDLRVFLAGAIDMGAAVDWQEQVTDRFDCWPNVIFYNPRRSDWDDSWEQSADNEQFAEQVEWELDKIEESDFVLMFLPEKSVAPITLLEFGYIMAYCPSKLIIAAEPGYWRRGNLEVVCRRNKIELHDSLEDCMGELINRL